MTIWILTVGCLIFDFYFQKHPKGAQGNGDSKILEIGNENNIYDEFDDDES